LPCASEVYGERFDLTLWEAARLVLEAAGETYRGEYGELRAGSTRASAGRADARA
jgi:hypothetical protein